MGIPLGLAIAAGAGQVGGGIYNLAAGAKQRREGERLFEQQLEDLRSGKYDLTVSQSQRDVADLARQYGEQAAMTAERRGAAAQQAALFGLRGGDPRLAAMMPAQTRATEEATQRAQLAGTGMALTAQQRLAGQEQAVLTQNEQARRMLEQMQMQRGAAAGEAGRQQQVAGIGQIASLPADLATLYTAAGGVKNLIPKGMKEMKNTISDLVGDFNVVEYAKKLRDQFGSGISPATTTTQSGYFNPRIPGNEHGGKAPMVTPGEFDHDTNPIDMVAEDGTKVGEVTGGELILNPEQSNTIEELVEKGDGDALVMYLKDLFEQPQFQES
jgi:hypothetical protein|tara:strand:+ start:514 stop:1494 length:981 start_codon:yes stop_codon:yes gene_type:complete